MQSRNVYGFDWVGAVREAALDATMAAVEENPDLDNTPVSVSVTVEALSPAPDEAQRASDEELAREDDIVLDPADAGVDEHLAEVAPDVTVDEHLDAAPDVNSDPLAPAPVEVVDPVTGSITYEPVAGV